MVVETQIKTKMQIRRYFEENVTTVMKRDISPETAQSEISKMNHLVLLAKETSLMVQLVVQKTKALRICLLISERSLKQRLERQFLLDILKAPRDINCMIQILAFSSVVVMLYSLKQNFMTLAVNSPPNHVFDYPPEDDVQVEVKNVPAVDEINDDHNEQPEELDTTAEDQEPINNNQLMGASYEDNFRRDREKRPRKPPTSFDEECYVANDLTADINEPVTINEAFSGEHSAEWRKATKSEYDSLINNHTWDFVPPPEGKNVVGSRIKLG